MSGALEGRTRWLRLGAAKPTARAPRRIGEYDLGLLWAILILLALGLVMVYSASIPMEAGRQSHRFDATTFLWRHATFLGVGGVLALVAFQIPSRSLQEMAPWLFFACVLLLAAVLVTTGGKTINGAQRWIEIGSIRFQPGELLKLCALLYVADYASRKAEFLHSLRRGLLPLLVVLVIVSFLLVKQRDFGTFVLVMGIAFGVLFMAGMSVRWFVILLALVGIGVVLLFLASPGDYKSGRWEAFLNIDPFDKPYAREGNQRSHALMAFARGQWFGVGLGASIEKLSWLYAAYSDFLFAVIAEELGFVGVFLVLGLYAWVVIRAFAIGRMAASQERPFAALVAQGIGMWLGGQALIHMAVNTDFAPTKGLTLPFLSYGGTSLVTCCVAAGILMRIDWEGRSLVRGLPA